jgi:transcription initiation factor TFIID subunit 3
MPAPTTLFHAFLRPSIIKMLRATGYHSTSPAVLDCVTDLAVRYLSLLCEKTAAHAVHNHGDAGDYTVVEARMALEEAGAMLPERVLAEQEWLGEEDLRGVEEFNRWFAGQRMKDLTEFANEDGEMDEADYLNGEFPARTKQKNRKSP